MFRLIQDRLSRSESNLRQDQPPSQTTPTDLELITRIKRRDQTALSDLYDRYAGRVYALAAAITRDAHAAEEATQDVFIRVWTRIEQHHAGETSFVAWLLAITRRCALDQMRAQARRVGREDELDDELPAHVHHGPLSDERARELRMLLDELPPEQREVIELAFYRDMSHSEIAAYLALPLGTVKTRARYGLNKIRAAWLQE